MDQTCVLDLGILTGLISKFFKSLVIRFIQILLRQKKGKNAIS